MKTGAAGPRFHFARLKSPRYCISQNYRQSRCLPKRNDSSGMNWPTYRLVAALHCEDDGMGIALGGRISALQVIVLHAHVMLGGITQIR